MEVKTFLEKDPMLYLQLIKKTKENAMPDIFILFLPPYIYDDQNFLNSLREALNPCTYITLSTIGSMSDERLIYDSLGGFSLKFERDGSFDTFFISDLSNSDIDVVKKEVESFLKPIKDTTYLIFSTASNLQLNLLLDSIFKSQEYPKIRLYGGVASSNLKGFETYISVNDSILQDGLIIIRLRNVVSYSTVSFGFIPVGTTYRVTKAKGNRIYELDGMSIEYFLYNLLLNTGVKPQDLDMHTTSEVLWEFPLLVIDQDKRYITSIRTFAEYDPENKGMSLYGLINENSLIKLATGDSEDLLRDVQARAKEFFDITIHLNRKPDLILNISCTARNYILLEDKKESKEQAIYHSFLKNFKVSGFLTFGEVGHDRFGKPGEFFNESSILVGLEEIWNTD